MIAGPTLRLTTLGAIDLRDAAGRPLREVVAQPKRVALLVYLLLEGRRGPVSRDRLLALFWPESDETRARNTLSQAIHHLRQALGPGVVESEGVHLLGISGERLWCDAVAFEEALGRGDTAAALEYYGGEFCPTLFVSGAPAVEEWLDEQRRRLHRRALAAARTDAEQLLSRGDSAAAARAARRALAMKPEDEADVRALLATLDRAGDVAGALQAYRDYERRLAADLEAEPAAETRRLVEAMRRRRESTAGETAAPARPAATQPPGPAPEMVPEPASPPSPAPGAPLRARWHRAALASLGAVALAALGIAVAVSWLGRRARTPAPLRAVAVFPFTVRGRADLDYLREGMVDLLSAKLEGTSGFRASDPRGVLAAVAGLGPGAAVDAESSARIARRLGARWYIAGDVVAIAGWLQISAALYDVEAGAQPVAQASVSGEAASLFELVDDLTGRILAGMIGGRDTALTRLAALTTRSLPALKAFLQGEQALRAGQDAQAAAAFREAATLDTTFALAEYRLAVVATWVNVPEVGNPTTWAEAAERHGRRLAPLARDLLSAYRAYRETRGDDAEQQYRTVTSGHPDNVEAWLMLGEVYFHYNPARGRPPMEAWAPFQRALALDSTSSHAMIHLARLAASEGRLPELDSLARRYLARYGDAERAIELRELEATAHQDVSAMASVATAVRRSDDYVALSVADAALMFAQNLDAGAGLAPRFLSTDDTTPTSLRHGWRLVSEVALAAGQLARGATAQPLGAAADHAWLLEVQALLASDPFFAVPRDQVAALRDSVTAHRAWPSLATLSLHPVPDLGGEMRTYLLGLLSVRLGDVAEADRSLAELDAVREPSHKASARNLALALRAEMARTRGDLSDALADLERFPFTLWPPGGPSLAHWGVRERFLRAELLHALGRDDEALRWYDSFLFYYDLPWMAAAHYRRGEIQDRMGRRDDARFHYGRFLQLWKDCDPELRPMTERARQALARLGGQGG